MFLFTHHSLLSYIIISFEDEVLECKREHWLQSVLQVKKRIQIVTSAISCYHPYQRTICRSVLFISFEDGVLGYKRVHSLELVLLVKKRLQVLTNGLSCFHPQYHTMCRSVLFISLEDEVLGCKREDWIQKLQMKKRLQVVSNTLSWYHLTIVQCAGQSFLSLSKTKCLDAKESISYYSCFK